MLMTFLGCGIMPGCGMAQENKSGQEQQAPTPG